MFDVLKNLQKGGVSNRDICALKGNPLQIGSPFNKGYFFRYLASEYSSNPIDQRGKTLRDLISSFSLEILQTWIMQLPTQTPCRELCISLYIYIYPAILLVTFLGWLSDFFQWRIVASNVWGVLKGTTWITWEEPTFPFNLDVASFLSIMRCIYPNVV